MKRFTHSLQWICALFTLVVIINHNAYSQYSGTHYIGSGEEFETIQEAVDSLVSKGVNGPVLMVVKAKTGDYNEQIVVIAIPGASGTNTITFESETHNPSDVMIYYNLSGSANNYVIFLNGASYITFQYFNIVNSTTSTTYNRVVAIDGTSENNSFKHNILTGRSGAQTSNNQAIFYANDDVINNTEISLNEINSGSYPIYLMVIQNIPLAQK